MGKVNVTGEIVNELLQAQAHIWIHIFSFINSMSLQCAIDLGIPDIIRNQGKPMIITDAQCYQGMQHLPVDVAGDTGNLGKTIANAFPRFVLIKQWILDDWSDDECVKILKRCKEAKRKG
ncbi:hypothetical protein F3Y22_tig00010888pilonHSYRG00017 [Hibiscus syriacus]|uniref:Uncharacterized protein n=1 Tax=Hibiscus syriacus TaxID=106335 RepID=A0A6A3C9E0_HIBSY|nr:hypothetical protein F3Y22_tig00010888pilonHSYRG00017 [Hibiscus syriacus]